MSGTSATLHPVIRYTQRGGLILVLTLAGLSASAFMYSIIYTEVPELPNSSVVVGLILGSGAAFGFMLSIALISEVEGL